MADLTTLPSIPDGFINRLSALETYGGKPMFRLVDGLRELKWRNGKWDVKHLMQNNGKPCYVKVSKTRFRRKFHGSDKFLIFRSQTEAKAAKVAGLSTVIEHATKEYTVPVGRPCWVVEVYISPDNICFDTWQANRFDYLEKNGISQKIDILGEYPRDGYYAACFDVVDDEGNAVSPSERTLDECRRRFQLASGDTRTVEDAIQGSHAAIKQFEQKTLERMNEQVFDYYGPTVMSRARGGVTGKPIAR